MSDVEEVERLRARIAELESQLVTTDETEASSKPGRRSPWWAIASAVLITLACLLAPLSVTSVWASMQISDTEQYVETVAPLADDPAVQNAIANEVTRVILTNLDVEQLTTTALESLAQQENVPPRVATALPALAVPITNGFESFTREQVRNLIASPRFGAAWETVNRVAHEQVVKLLEGNEGGAVSAQGNTVTLNLAPIVEAVKDRLVAQGFTLANNVPAVDTSFVLVQSDAITQAQGLYRLLNTMGAWLPFLALALFVAGVALAKDRRRALLRGALGVTAAMVVLGVILAVVRMLYVGATPANVLTEQAAGNVFDALVRFLRTGLRAAAVLGLVVALAAFLTGPSSASVGTRSVLKRGIASLRSGAEDAGFHTGRIGTWTFTNKGRLRVAVVIAGGLVLMFWTIPTAGVVLVTALLVGLALVVIEFIGQPPRPTSGSAPMTAESGSEEPVVPRQTRRTPTTDTASRDVAPESLQPAEEGKQRP